MTAHARNGKYIAILAGVSASILIAGALLRPAPDATTSAAPPPPSETDLLRLTRLSQRRSLESMADYFGYVADAAARSLAFALVKAGEAGLAANGAPMIAGPVVDPASASSTR